MFLSTDPKIEFSPSFESSQVCSQFKFSEIRLATQNFDESLVIGHGGFGKVYKGTITYETNRLTVAIKRLDLASNQGAVEFWAEVKMLSKLRHCHLVSLIGYCNDGEEMILVYEYMPHGTLEDHLHKSGISLTWMRRLQICIGAARGLDYLHTGTGIKHGVIHRDGRLQNGQDIAVAEIFSNKYVENHMREVSILVKCEHDNLVKLLGYCIEGTKVFLVYEFVSNASLYQLLWDPKKCTRLSWNKLYTIILGVAKVLVYLHKHAPTRMIHGNIGPRNILLDDNFDPKLSDFRFATTINDTDCIHVEAVRGTLGYAAPEYLIKGVLSTKVDVYNLGMLVLKIITDHRKPYSLLIEHVQKNRSEGTLSNIVNPRIDVDSSSLTKFIEIGLLCVQEDPLNRPTMEEVVSMMLDSSSFTQHELKMGEIVSRECSNSTSTTVNDYDTCAVEEFISDLCPR